MIRRIQPKVEVSLKSISSIKKVPLVYLSIKLARLRAGAQDFLFEVKALGDPSEKPKVVTLRADKSFAKKEGCISAVEVLFREMKAKGEPNFDWEQGNVEHLANMILPYCKTFITFSNMDNMGFTSDALKQL